MERRRTLLLRETRPSTAVGIAFAVGSVAAITALIYPLKHAMPAVSTGVLYLLAVLVVSTYWGLRLGLLTSLLSTAAFNIFHIPPVGSLTIAEPQNWVALGVFLVAAVIASTVAELARARAIEAERRGEEAALAADLARVLLGGTDLGAALAPAAHRLAGALELPSAALELSPVPGDSRRIALPLDLGEGRKGTLLLPASVEPGTLERLRERVLPALEALLTAALDRAALQQEVVETEALRFSDSVKTALLRTVSHDLRTPLTTILAGSAALRSPGVTAEEREELAESIGQQAMRLSRLVDQLLDLSRLEAGTAPPRRDWHAVEELVRSAVDEVDGGDERFRVSIERDLPLINVDGAQLERALVNLLENASRYSGGQPVRVRAARVSERLVMRIVDRGPGIPPHELPRIFEPFYRAGDADHSGSGLGLAIAKGFVEANGGRLSAESLPGQGTTFVIEMPLPATSAEPEPVPIASAE